MPGERLKVAVLDDYQRVARTFADWSGLEARAEITVFDTPLGNEAEVRAKLQPFHVLAIMRERTPIPSALIQALPNLRCIVTTGLRNKALDIEAATARGIVVSGTQIPPYPTAEHTLALILALARNIPHEHERMRQGLWMGRVARDLRGRTLGVIGLGRLGAEVASFAKPIGMDIIAWSPNLTAERAAEVGVRAVDKVTLLETADVITIHLVLSERSRGTLGAADLALMKPTALLVNTSRGPLIDTGALIEALRAGRIGGAALDVYDEEPLPAGHPLRSLDNVVLSPHIGYVTEDTYRMMYTQTVEAITAFLDGTPLRTLG